MMGDSHRPLRPACWRWSQEGLCLDLKIAYHLRRAGRHEEAWLSSLKDELDAGIRAVWSGCWEAEPDVPEEAGDSLQSLLLTMFPEAVAADCWPEGGLPVHVQISSVWTRHPHWDWFRAWVTGRRRPVMIYLRQLHFFPAHVASHPFRRLWGIVRTPYLLALGLNWTPSYPGYMVLPADRRPAQVIAHEMGHILGLDDAYAAWYRGYDPAPGPERMLMRCNGALTRLELVMALRAAQSGRMQFFPRRWSWRTFWSGLARQFRLKARCRDLLKWLLKGRSKR